MRGGDLGRASSVARFGDGFKQGASPRIGRGVFRDFPAQLLTQLDHVIELREGGA